jgi:predicted transcriptional regulator
VIDASGPYTVTVMNEFGCVSTSPAYTAVGVENLDKNSFVVYPNPAVNTITIAVQNNEIGSIYNVTDCTGKIVLTGKVNSITHQISLDNLSAGVYQISIYPAKENLIQTIIKMD